MKIDKVVRLGAGECGDVFCKIKYDGERLSITGVEGPKENGDARGSCGQILDHLAVNTFAPGWDAGLVERFRRTWADWHLNDMRAGCEHQRQADVSEKVEVVTYGLTSAAYHERNSLIAVAAQAQASGKGVDLTETGKALILLSDWYKDRFQPPDADSPLSGCFEVKKRESKGIGWVTPNEHPRGLLGRACDVCGYKYGSAWLKEEVPAEVVEFLAGLPESDKVPAWV